MTPRGVDVDRQQEFVLRTLEERDIRFVRLWFTDVLGTLKSVSVAPAELESAFEEGMGIDGSAIVAASRNREGDVPDLRWDASGVTQACPGLAEPGRFANPLGSVAGLAIGHGSEYGCKSESCLPDRRFWFEARLL